MRSKEILDLDFEAQALGPAELVSAFSRFTEASNKLSKRYETLRLEAEGLRVRLREKDEEIKRTARLAMLGETAAAIAHEVRNPLGAIKLFISLLTQDVKENKGAVQLLEQMNKSVESLDNVVTNILQFSKSSEVGCSQRKFSPVHLLAITQEQIERVKNSTGAGTEFLVEWKVNPFMMGDEHTLRSAVFNILLNAVQALKKGGVVKIKAEETASGILTLSLSDSGQGISEEIIARVFEPFVTTKSEGTGLGLAVVRQIIEQHGGRIRVENRPEEGVGARFILELPRTQVKRSGSIAA